MVPCVFDFDDENFHENRSNQLIMIPMMMIGLKIDPKVNVEPPTKRGRRVVSTMWRVIFEENDLLVGSSKDFGSKPMGDIIVNSEKMTQE
ncbi:hypothetical protein H5410_010918 [Solanum commersonii]|uniref:Uncharacterized protein n=1 Tax=Solanum commersonii TaxID=4109 RepID=A0A9J6AMW2_SOLCO|nr:hypothetical protein H5410_010918 [Solanum commersonii]